MTYVSRCTGCGTCVEKCPQKAISLKREGEETIILTDRDRCINCGDCAEACRFKAREVVGKLMTVKEVMDKVLRDKIFYEASGGGLTVSGGECLIYPEFTEALLYEAKKDGLHTAVESCCFGDREAVDRIFRFADLGLLDIKHMDSNLHKEFTGVPNETILDNIRHIYHDLRIPLYIRIPIIPGCNDSEANIANTAKFVVERLGTDVQVHLLPYHRFGESKNESLGRKQKKSIDSPSDGHMQKLKTIIEGFGLQAQIGG